MTSNEQVMTIPSTQHYGNSGIEVLPFMSFSVYPPEQRRIIGIVLTMEMQAFFSPSGFLLLGYKTTCALKLFPIWLVFETPLGPSFCSWTINSLEHLGTVEMKEIPERVIRDLLFVWVLLRRTSCVAGRENLLKSLGWASQQANFTLKPATRCILEGIVSDVASDTNIDVTLNIMLFPLIQSITTTFQQFH